MSVSVHTCVSTWNSFGCQSCFRDLGVARDGRFSNVSMVKGHLWFDKL